MSELRMRESHSIYRVDGIMGISPNTSQKHSVLICHSNRLIHESQSALHRVDAFIKLAEIVYLHLKTNNLQITERL